MRRLYLPAIVSVLVLTACGDGSDEEAARAVSDSVETYEEVLEEARIAEAAATAALEDHLTQATIRVEDAWVRKPLAGRDLTAGYARFQASAPLVLIGASSPDAERIELHDVEMDDTSVMRMRRQDRFVLDNGALVFEPGGAHLMIFGLDPEAVDRGTLEITFTFEQGPETTVTFEVRAV